MIDEILEAVRQEALAFLQEISDPSIGTGTVIVETDFKTADLSNYSMPLLIIDMVDGQETSQYPGGATRVDWMFGFNSYHYMPDAGVDDESGYSTSLLQVIDQIRRHFSTGHALDVWLTEGMSNIFEKYNFQFTLLGVSRAKVLNADGLIMGWRLGFDSISIDTDTEYVVLSESELEHVVQVDQETGVDITDEQGHALETEGGQPLTT